MKYLVILTDGAGDRPIETLGNKTPLEAAEVNTIDKLAKMGEVGMVKTVPDGMSPGSDVANLSVMSYDPAIYHTGRSPLEAASMGVDMESTDVSFRVNLVTLNGDGPYEEKTIVDHSSGEISSEEAELLIKTVRDAFGNETIQFYPGVSYRHAMIVKNGSLDYLLTPPHDVLGQKTKDHLPKGEGVEFITEMMKASFELLKNHPVNLARIEKGLNPANSLWIWGEGRKPALTSFPQKYGIKGAAISAVDLIKGIAICAGMESIDVPGATGTLSTNFKGKAEAAIQALKNGTEYIYVHLEAPDECGHQGDVEGKVRSLEEIDKQIVYPIFEYLQSTGEPYKIMVLPDHSTPLAIRTHSSEPVPFVIYDSRKNIYTEENAYSESAGRKSGLFFDNGYKLTDYFLKEVR